MDFQWRRGVHYFVAYKKHDERGSGGRIQNDLGKGSSRVGRTLPESE